MPRLTDIFAQSPDAQRPGFGLRTDQTRKELGYFGVLNRPQGGVSTELSAGFNIGGKEVLAPLLVPTLTRQEIDLLLSGGKPTTDIYRKSIEHAIQRLKINKSPFAEFDEIHPLPSWDSGTGP